jgi:hypothetical protein
MLGVARVELEAMVAVAVGVLAELHDQTAAKADTVVVAARAVAVPAVAIIMLVILILTRLHHQSLRVMAIPVPVDPQAQQATPVLRVILAQLHQL